jgi:hypothetical protein
MILQQHEMCDNKAKLPLEDPEGAFVFMRI